MWDKLTKIFTKARLILLGKVVVSVVGLVASLLIIATEWMAGVFWGPGVIFGFVVLVWHATSLRSITKWRSVAFLIAATGIYTAVSILWFYAFIRGASEVIIITFAPYMDLDFIATGLLILSGGLLGSILLPIVHSLLLGSPRKRVFIAIPCIFGGFLIACLPFAFLDDISVYICVPIIVWQATYLVSMFGFRKKEAVEIN
jgi:hypothetical protein